MRRMLSGMYVSLDRAVRANTGSTFWRTASSLNGSSLTRAGTSWSAEVDTPRARPVGRSALQLRTSRSAGSSLAHIGYGSGAPQSATSRDFGTVSSGYAFTFTGRTVTSNFGWADASDLNLAFDANFAATRPASSDEASWGLGGFTTGVDNLYFGDSHKGTAFRFHLDAATTVVINLSGVTGAAGATGGALTPAFSVYKGLAALSPFSGTQTSADYDFSVASRDQRTSWAQ